MLRKLLLSLALSSLAGACLSSQSTSTSSPTPGPAATQPMSLPQLLDLAHRASPVLLAAAQHLAAVRAQEVTAGLRQNPGLLAGAQMVTLNPGDANGTEFYNFGVQRLFERGNKRSLRLDVARATTSLTVFELDDQRRQTDLAIRQAFSRMLYAREALAISRENLADYQKTVALMQTRLDAGAIDRTDFERVELQLAGFESDRENAQLTLLSGSIALQTLAGIAHPRPDFTISGDLDPPELAQSLDELKQHALDTRPDLAAAHQQLQVNAAAIKLAQAASTADPTFEAEYERAGRSNSVGGTVNLPLRLFDRNQGERQRTRYELESSRLALDGAERQVASDVETAWAGYRSARVQAERYRSKYLAEAAHVRDNLAFSYRNGNTTLLDYLSALADYRSVNLAYLNARLQLLLSIEQLSYAANTEILP